MKWLKIQEVADYFNVSRATIYRWAKKGLIKICYIDNQVPRIAQDEIKKIEERMEKGEG